MLTGLCITRITILTLSSIGNTSHSSSTFFCRSLAASSSTFLPLRRDKDSIMPIFTRCTTDSLATCAAFPYAKGSGCTLRLIASADTSSLLALCVCGSAVRHDNHPRRRRPCRVRNIPVMHMIHKGTQSPETTKTNASIHRRPKK